MRYRLLIAAALTAGACFVGETDARASSHREAPFVTKNPKVDSTDVYAFKSYEAGRAGYVTILANYQPLQDPYGGPNYFSLDPEALYEIHVDNDGDGVEDTTFQFQFQNALNAGGGAGQCSLCNLPVTLEGTTKTNSVALLNVGGIGPAVANTAALHVVESYKLTMVKGDRRTGAATALGGTFRKPVDNIGSTTIPDYDTYANNHISEFDIPGCTPPAGTKPRVFVGQRAEPLEITVGVNDHSRRSLDQRLNDQGGDLSAIFRQDALDLAETGDRAIGTCQSEWAAVTMRARDADGRKEQRPEHRVEPLDAADAHVAERVAVIRTAERDELRPARLGVGFLPPVLESHLERDLDGGRPVVREKDAGQALGGALDEAAGKLGGGRMGHA